MTTKLSIEICFSLNKKKKKKKKQTNKKKLPNHSMHIEKLILPYLVTLFVPMKLFANFYNFFMVQNLFFTPMFAVSSTLEVLWTLIAHAIANLKRSYHVHMVKWSFFVLSNPKKKIQNADDISSKITFDENLAICLSLRFRLSITIGLS